MESFEKVFMRPAAGRGTWSHSDFMSTRGSFSSLSNRSLQQHTHQGHPHAHAHAHGHAHGHSQQPGAAGAAGGGGAHHPQCPHHPQYG